MKLYKVLHEDGRCYHGGTGQWPLPNGQPGAWMEAKGELVPCKNAIHALKREHLVSWIGPAIFEFEADGEWREHDDKMYGRRGRLVRRIETWTERAACLFTADCAERVVHLTGPDERCVRAIKVARRFADAQATREELIAARAAARAAERAAAWLAGDAAWAAERAWQTERLFEILEGRLYAEAS